MPCTCWYDPPEGSKRIIKDAVKTVVDEVKIISKDDDPLGFTIEDVKKLMDHMYYGNCDEKHTT